MSDVRIIGLTGGIACGKSLVGMYMRELGANVVDADELSRRVVVPGTPGLAKLHEAFGARVIAGDGTLDRRALGALAFSDPAALTLVEQILHPLINDELEAEISRATDVLVYENAILFEKGGVKRCDRLIVTHVPQAVQIARVVKRNGLTEDEARRRIAAQWPQDKKVATADYVIDTSGTKDELRRIVAAVWRDVRRA